MVPTKESQWRSTRSASTRVAPSISRTAAVKVRSSPNFAITSLPLSWLPLIRAKPLSPKMKP